MRNDELPIVEFEPLGRRVRVAAGTTLLEAARQAGVGLSAVCGGGGSCGTCRVRIIAGQVTPARETESDAVVEGLRLACQARVLSDVRVSVPPSSITAPQRAQIEGYERPIEFDPPVRIYDVTVAPASLSDLRADATRFLDALREQRGIVPQRVDYRALCRLPVLLREQGWRVRAIVRPCDAVEEVIAVTPSDVSPLGLAVDIGTTKLAAYLVDLESGDWLAAHGTMNPQIAYGEDVMARIVYAMKGEEQAGELQRAIAGGLNDLVRELCAQISGDCTDIVEAVLVGNTCMHHLVLGLPVRQLGLAPYVPALADPFDLRAHELGLDLAPGACVHLLPNIAGFVGADHVAMILATGIHETDAITLGLDIGTNTEIVLAANGRLLSCSCASGPAFEGAHIRDGMRAAPGAIERIRIEGDSGQAHPIEYQTIDDAPPVGICGSGILDGVAELRRVGVLGANGAIQPISHPRVRGTGADAEFLLVPAGERGAPHDLVITRKDVNEIQLAKAAIRAGIEVLLSEAGLRAEQIERVVVAGAFGTYLDMGSALAVGMFPPLPRERFTQVGNAAGMGAKMALLSHRARTQAAAVARRVEYVELTTHPRFVETYAAALMLP